MSDNQDSKRGEDIISRLKSGRDNDHPFTDISRSRLPGAVPDILPPNISPDAMNAVFYDSQSGALLDADRNVVHQLKHFGASRPAPLQEETMPAVLHVEPAASHASPASEPIKLIDPVVPQGFLEATVQREPTTFPTLHDNVKPSPVSTVDIALPLEANLAPAANAAALDAGKKYLSATDVNWTTLPGSHGVEAANTAEAAPVMAEHAVAPLGYTAESVVQQLKNPIHVPHDPSVKLITEKEKPPARSAGGMFGAVEKPAEGFATKFTQFMKNEKWVGKKGLAFAAATVGAGAVITGAGKLMGQKKEEGVQRS